MGGGEGGSWDPESLLASKRGASCAVAVRVGPGLRSSECTAMARNWKKRGLQVSNGLSPTSQEGGSKENDPDIGSRRAGADEDECCDRFCADCRNGAAMAGRAGTRDEGRMSGSGCPRERHNERDACRVGVLGWWCSRRPGTQSKSAWFGDLSGMSPRLSGNNDNADFIGTFGRVRHGRTGKRLPSCPVLQAISPVERTSHLRIGCLGPWVVRVHRPLRRKAGQGKQQPRGQGLFVDRRKM